MSHEYVYKISSRYLQKWLRYSIKHVKNRHFSRHFGTLPWFSEFCFLLDFDASKSVLGSFFAFFAKIWPKIMYRSTRSRKFFCLTFFTWWPEMTLTCIMVTKHRKWYLQMSVTPIHADSLTLFALNIEILLADVTKPEKSKILTLTWPVTSSVTSGSNFWPCTGSSRTGAIEWRLKFGNRSSSLGDLRGGPLAPPPPPQQDVLLTRPQRGEG